MLTLPTLKLKIGLFNTPHDIKTAAFPRAHIINHEYLCELLLREPLDLNEPSLVEGNTAVPIHVVLDLPDVRVGRTAVVRMRLLEPVSYLVDIPLLHLLIIFVLGVCRVDLTYCFQILPLKDPLIGQIRRPNCRDPRSILLYWRGSQQITTVNHI